MFTHYSRTPVLSQTTFGGVGANELENNSSLMILVSSLQEDDKSTYYKEQLDDFPCDDWDKIIVEECNFKALKGTSYKEVVWVEKAEFDEGFGSLFLCDDFMVDGFFKNNKRIWYLDYNLTINETFIWKPGWQFSHKMGRLNGQNVKPQKVHFDIWKWPIRKKRRSCGIVKQWQSELKTKFRIGEIANSCDEGCDRLITNEQAVTICLLVSLDQIGCTAGKSELIVQTICFHTGIMEDNHLIACAIKSDELVHLSGKVSNVRKALFQIASRHVDPSTPNVYSSGGSIIGAPIMGNFRQNLEETGMGYGLEVEMINKAHKMGLLTTPYTFNENEATEMTKAGADIIVAHMGLMTSGSIGAKTAVTLEESVIRVQVIAAAAHKINPDALVLCHGGPIYSPTEAEFILKNIKGVDGFYGASSLERLPVEQAIKGTLQQY